MSFDQYHEPPEELSAETRTFARMITSLIEEAEAIGWYEQRLSLEKDRQAKAIMKNAQHEEMKHFVECVAANRMPRETFEDGYVVNCIVDAMYRSIGSKRWEPVEIPAI